MPEKAIELLDVREDGIYVDGTLGRGGHSRLILERLKTGKLYCFDLDEEAIRESKENLKEFGWSIEPPASRKERTRDLFETV